MKSFVFYFYQMFRQKQKIFTGTGVNVIAVNVLDSLGTKPSEKDHEIDNSLSYISNRCRKYYHYD
jgi:hypothetical protein